MMMTGRMKLPSTGSQPSQMQKIRMKMTPAQKVGIEIDQVLSISTQRWPQAFLRMTL